MNSQFELTILGCGSAIPTLNRNPSAQVLNIQEKLYLIDCGEGTQISLRKNKIKFQRINQIFISHLHGDHYLGLIGLLSTFNLLGRNTPITIFSPSGLKELVELHFKLSDTSLNYPVNFIVINTDKKEIIYENKSINIYALPLIHRIETYGFLFVEKTKLKHINSEETKKFGIPHYKFQSLKNGDDYFDENTGLLIPNEKLTKPADQSFSYAYCSDTAYYPELINWISNTDLLYHEATFMDKDKAIAQRTFHSTTLQAAEIAKQAKAKQLLIGHYSGRYLDADLLVKECKTVFENTQGAEDGKVLSLSKS